MDSRNRLRSCIKCILLIPCLWFLCVMMYGIFDVLHKESAIDLGVVDKLLKKADESYVEYENPKSILEENTAKIYEQEVELQQEHEKFDVKQEDTIEERKEINEQLELDSSAPGEMGRPVIIDKEKLSPEERIKFDEGWKNNAFNQYASDMVSLHRSLADIRDPECKTITWYDPLPTTSVIIIFHNEAWSVLLRTIHSVLDRSDPKLLHEVLVVDDFSSMDHLKEPLQQYIDGLDKVKLIRTTKREGLIRARLAGTEQATGDALIFLDSHCEATEGWLEPLLDPIARNSNTSVVPLIEIIDDNTFELKATALGDIQVGGFDWSLIFNWHAIPKYELERRKHRTDPIRSPTMAGGLFAIDRKYFDLLGRYDSGMDIWGGENLELSFKVWMCGGELVCAPCSHVGHVFRSRSPYSWPEKQNPLRRNTVRLAEVWLDEYKKNFFEQINFDSGDYGDVSDRKKLRENLNCNSFEWFLKNIYPEQFLPNESEYYGEIRNGLGDTCLDGESERKNKPIIGYPCHGQGGNQYWIFTKSGEIRRDTNCVDYAGGSANIGIPDKLITYICHGQRGNQEWYYTPELQIKHRSGYCIELSADKKSIMMEVCDNTKQTQIWHWKKREINQDNETNSKEIENQSEL